MKTYPEHEKLRKVQKKSQMLGEFLDHCSRYINEGTIGRWVVTLTQNRVTTPKKDIQIFLKEIVKLKAWGKKNKKSFKAMRISSILAGFYGVDEQKLDEEKRDMLQSLRKA